MSEPRWVVTILAQGGGGEVLRSLQLTPEQYVAFERALKPFLEATPTGEAAPPPASLAPTKVIKALPVIPGRRQAAPRRPA